MLSVTEIRKINLEKMLEYTDRHSFAEKIGVEYNNLNQYLAKKNPKHSIAYWAAEVIRRNSLKLDARTLAKEASKLTEEHGAGDIGTDELVKKYKKDTPGQ